MKKNLLVVYRDSFLSNKLKLNESFEIIIIPKIKSPTLEEYKINKNVLIAKYNDILFSTDSDLVFFVCSSELNDSTIKSLSNFKILEKDFDFFVDKKTKNLIRFLSGLVIKKDTLLRLGCFDKYIPYNLYFNFLINYSRFCNGTGKSLCIIPHIRINIFDYSKYTIWKYFEESFYLSQPLYKNYYLALKENLENISFRKSGINKSIIHLINKIMTLSSVRINKFIEDNTNLGYWWWNVSEYWIKHQGN